MEGNRCGRRLRLLFPRGCRTFRFLNMFRPRPLRKLQRRLRRRCRLKCAPSLRRLRVQASQPGRPTPLRPLRHKALNRRLRLRPCPRSSELAFPPPLPRRAACSARLPRRHLRPPARGAQPPFLLIRGQNLAPLRPRLLHPRSPPTTCRNRRCPHRALQPRVLRHRLPRHRIRLSSTNRTICLTVPPRGWVACGTCLFRSA